MTQYSDNKYHVSVGSTSFNLAGDPEGRPEYLKTVMANAMLFNKDIPATLQQGMMNGPASRIMAFHRWYKLKYGVNAVPKDSMGGTPLFKAVEVEAILQANYGLHNITVDWADWGLRDVGMFARRWLCENNQTVLYFDWTSDYNPVTHTISISWSGSVQHTLPAPADYLLDGQYMYASYYRIVDSAPVLGMFIYNFTHGTDLDLNSLLNAGIKTDNEYLPVIPIRLDNKFLSETFEPTKYEKAKKGYKKAFAQSYDKLVDQLAENDDLGDLDYIYLMFGVSLNTPTQAGQRYLFEFFDDLRTRQAVQKTIFDEFTNPTGSDANSWFGYITKKNQWDSWYDEMVTLPPDEAPPPEPPRATTPTNPRNVLSINTNYYDNISLDIRISFHYAEKTTGTGQAWVGALPNKFNVVYQGREDYIITEVGTGKQIRIPGDIVLFHRQITVNTFETIKVHGLMSENRVFDGRSVKLTAKEAFDTEDGEESNFIMPLNYGTFRGMNAAARHQLGMESAHLLVNYYQVKKKKFYERGAFKVILVLVLVIVTLASGGFGASSVGFLGTNAAVGAAIGFTGVAATIAGAVANIIAAMIVSRLVMAGLTAIVGEEWAAIITAIAAAVTITMGNMDAGNTLFQTLSDPAMLIKISAATGSGIADAMAFKTNDILEKTQELLGEYKTESERISEMYKDVLGYRTVLYDPLALAQVGPYYTPEDLDSFLARTLLTGSDVADITMGAVPNFVRQSLDLTLE